MIKRLYGGAFLLHYEKRRRKGVSCGIIGQGVTMTVGGSSHSSFLESEVVRMDIQVAIELASLVIAAIGLGIYIERKK